MPTFKRVRLRAEDLVADTRPWRHFQCSGCYAKLTLKRDDPRVGSGMAPRCERCGSKVMCVIEDPHDVTN